MSNYSNTTTLATIDTTLVSIDAVLTKLEALEEAGVPTPRVYRAMLEARVELLKQRQEARIAEQENRAQAPARSPEPVRESAEEQLERELEFEMQLDGRPTWLPVGRIQSILDKLEEFYPVSASTTRRGLVLRLMGWRRMRQFARSATVRDGAFTALCDGRMATLAGVIKALG